METANFFTDITSLFAAVAFVQLYPRFLASSRIASVAVAPILATPSSITFSNSSSDLTPPAAFIWTSGEQRKGLDWLKKGMEGMGDELAFGKGKNVTAAGTFNANALQGLVGGTAPERTAKATEATQKNTKLLVDLVRNKPDSAFA